MNSLQELNGYGASSLEVTDNRYAGIKYTPAPPVSPFTQILNITSTSVTVNAGIDITEIINYSTANVRYRVTIVPGAVNPLTGSSISWASLPSGVTLSTVGNVYTLSGINSVAQWQAVKSFTWTLPANYATKPFWYLQVSVLYYDEELGVERTVDWEAYDEDFYYVAELSASSSLSCNALDVILGSASLSGAFTPVMNFIRVKRFNIGMVVESTVVAEGQINADNLIAIASIPTAKLNYNKGNIKANISASASVVCNGVKIISKMIARSYVANNENLLFSSNTPQIDDLNTSGATYSITFSSSIGTFSSDSYVAPTSPFTYSGSYEQVNLIFSQIRFYPTKSSTASGTFTYTQQKNAVTQVTRTIDLTGSAGSYTTTTYSFTANEIWTPKNIDTKYGVADILLVGGGGGSGGQGGGGGGGGVYETTNQTIAQQTYTVTIGSGGLGASFASPVVGIPAGNAGLSGYPGTSTTAFGFTAGGGGGGGGYLNLSGGVYTYNKFGGASGSPQNNAGGTYSGTVTGYVPSTFNRGGGGGSPASVGANGPNGNGGAGYTSTINGLVYAQGGGGYATGSPSNQPPPNTGRGGSDVGLYKDGATGFALIRFHA